MRGTTENEIATIVVDKCLLIHRKWGPGLFESVYEEVLAYELEKSGLRVEKQKIIEVVYDDIKMDKGFKADIIVENKVILELKAVEHILPVHQKQLLTYLKLTEMKLGLLINFNVALIKNGIQRIVNNL
ncbi:MAG TPA: GxxExxY protein [Chitinophagaceae bacterium]|nr:GxxExxY protein [Chitinophagaceae bacterium]